MKGLKRIALLLKRIAADAAVPELARHEGSAPRRTAAAQLMAETGAM